MRDYYMAVKIFLETPLDESEIYRLAETTDLMFRRLRNIGYARRHVDSILPNEYTAMEAAAARIIKTTPVDVKPASFVNKRNLAVLRVVTMSTKRAVCLGGEGRIYSAKRGHLFLDGRFIPTAETLTTNFILVSAKREVELTRIAVLRPTSDYIN